MNLITIAFITTLVSSSTHQIQKSNDNLRRKLQNGTTAGNQTTTGKAFEPWDRSTTPFPCTPQTAPDETQGLFYIKVPKTGSSQLARVTARVAGREAKRQGLKNTLDDPTICKIHNPMVHTYAHLMNVAKRDKEKSFLWSMIRQPEDRAISHFAMNCKLKHNVPTPEDFLFELEHDARSYIPNLQVMFLFPHVNIYETKGEDYEEYVDVILNEYNFVGVYERLHESLVVLSMIMGVDVTDVMYDFEGSHTSRCGKLTKPSWAKDVRVTSYFESGEWRARDKGDYILHDAVNKSLDLTIEKLGRERVEQKLKEYEKLLDIGSQAAQKLKGQDYGCGIQGLHPRQTPFSDLKDLFWVNELSQEDKDFLNSTEYTIA